MIVDFALAWLLGIVFQYFTIAPMRHLPLGRGIWAAIKADTLSIVAFEVGLFGWMAAYELGFWRPPIAVNTALSWFMMQVGMVIGFFTAWPVNVWLLKAGFKERM
jgi:hypothetical protein